MAERTISACIRVVLDPMASRWKTSQISSQFIEEKELCWAQAHSMIFNPGKQLRPCWLPP